MTAFTGDENAIAYYADLRSFASIFKTAIYDVVTWISDAFIVRCRSYAHERGPMLSLIGIPHIHRLGPELLGRAATFLALPR